MLAFDHIIGHERIKEHLQEAIRQDTLSHAYIFSGESGSGKKLLASTLAAALLCEGQGDSVKPCGRCKSCIQASSGNHPDIRMVTHEKSTLGVDDIRSQVSADMAIKPYSSPYKVYIIPDCDRMTEQAGNALLKTIEEPPAYARIFLLTNNAASMLPTILSRCVTLDMKPVSTEKIYHFLIDKHHTPEQEAASLAAFCQGNVGKAVRYAASEDFHEINGTILHLLKSVDKLTLSDIMASIKELAAHKTDIGDYIDLMILWYRDLLLYKSTGNASLLLYKRELASIQSQAAAKSYASMDAAIRAMEQAKTRLKANVGFEATLELMILAMKQQNER